MLKVLIAEDELMIADLIEETLIEAGYEVCDLMEQIGGTVRLVSDHETEWTIAVPNEVSRLKAA